MGDTLHTAAVHAGVEEGDAEAPGVLLQGFHGVEAHGLVVHEGDKELQGGGIA